MEKKTYDEEKRKSAITRASLRGVVAAYLIYLAVTIVRGVYIGNTTMSVPVGWCIGVVLFAAAVAFGVYTLRNLIAQLAAAVLTNDQDDENKQAKEEDAP